MTHKSFGYFPALAATFLVLLSGCGGGASSGSTSSAPKLSPEVEKQAGEAGVPVEKKIDLGEGVTITLRFVPAGQTLLGSPLSDPLRGPDELIASPVKVDAFYMSAVEITQAQYSRMMDKNPSVYMGGELPVENISWMDANMFCEKVSALSGQAIRLPTEAQWEYACRAGGVEAYSFGGDAKQLKHHGWFMENSETRCHRVGTLKPNAFGLYDLHGNVWEWTTEAAPAEFGKAKPQFIRGGAWSDKAEFCRAASRVRVPPEFKNFNIGLRIVVGLTK